MPTLSPQISVLVLDDELPVSKAVCMLLSHLKYSPHAINNQELLAPSLEKFRPELLILDYWMYPLNGHAMAEKLHASHPSLPIVILSGSVCKIPKILPENVKKVIQKPIGLDEMRQTLEEVLGAIHKT